MQKLTRRGLMKQVSIGAGAISMLITATPVQAHLETSHLTSSDTAEQSVSATSDEALVIWVNNPATDTLTVMRGEHAITIKDSTLVQRLLAL